MSEIKPSKTMLPNAVTGKKLKLIIIIVLGLLIVFGIGLYYTKSPPPSPSPTPTPPPHPLRDFHGSVTIFYTGVNSSFVNSTHVDLQTASVYHQMNYNDVFKNWQIAKFTIPKGSRLLGVHYTISSFPLLHVEFFLVDGAYDYSEVVDDRSIRTNVICPVNTGSSGSVTCSVPLYGYQVQDTLFLAVWAHDME